MSALRKLVHRDVRKVVIEAERQGWKIKQTQGGIILRSPDGVSTAGCHRSPTDHHWQANFMAEMRRGGFKG